MKLEDINVDETYNVRVKVNGYNLAKTAVRAWDCSGLPCYFKLEDLSPISPSPKYDPCRLFREGDIVEPCKVNGRWLSPPWEHRTGIGYEVTEDENPITADLYIKGPDSPEPFRTHAAFFKLVAPVEELEPYSVTASTDDWCVQAKQSRAIISRYSKRLHPHALEAAEAERDRLNAEYRKEMGR
jgi:hypothetical protein